MFTASRPDAKHQAGLPHPDQLPQGGPQERPQRHDGQSAVNRLDPKGPAAGPEGPEGLLQLQEGGQEVGRATNGGTAKLQDWRDCSLRSSRL